MSLTQLANQKSVHLPSIADDLASVDVCFDGQRVWSIDVREFDSSGPRSVNWPKSLVPYLRGTTQLSLHDSANGEEIESAEVEFSTDPSRTSVTDDRGNFLAVNKWGRVAKTLTRSDDSIHERILDHTTDLVQFLEERNLRPFVVGGTLLGGVRDGALLPHDDDADIAYLSQYTNPTDVAREGFQLGHELDQAGYELVRHSATHMQLYFRDEDGNLDHYVDVFSAFFDEDGFINQPFHVRGEMDPEDMLPFGTVTIMDRSYPAPQNPDRWLTINYDEHWRTPIPGFHLATPRSTSRRFQNWFGSYHFKRDYWNDEFDEHGAHLAQKWQLGADWIAEHTNLLAAPQLLEIGGGSGQLAERLSSEARRVVTSDYAKPALRLAEARGVETLHVNLYRTLSLLAPRDAGFDGPFDLIANHLLEQVGHLARGNILRLARMAVRSGGTAIVTTWGRPAPDVNFSDPTTWHLEKYEIARDAKKLGLQTEFFDIPASGDAAGRRPYAAQFSAGTGTINLPPKERTLKNQLRRLARRALPGGTGERVEVLNERVKALEAELDEYRRDSLRVAEMLDVIEQALDTNRIPQGSVTRTATQVAETTTDPAAANNTSSQDLHTNEQE
ncbi:MAG: LicD family protein [Canibacter sp.]